jgi:hypothetical protein
VSDARRTELALALREIVANECTPESVTAWFAGMQWRLNASGPRVPDGSFLGCGAAEIVPGGNHEIVLGYVIAAEAPPRVPLVYRDQILEPSLSSSRAPSR